MRTITLLRPFPPPHHSNAYIIPGEIVLKRVEKPKRHVVTWRNAFVTHPPRLICASSSLIGVWTLESVLVTLNLWACLSAFAYKTMDASALRRFSSMGNQNRSPNMAVLGKALVCFRFAPMIPIIQGDCLVAKCLRVE